MSLDSQGGAHRAVYELVPAFRTFRPHDRKCLFTGFYQSTISYLGQEKEAMQTVSAFYRMYTRLRRKIWCGQEGGSEALCRRVFGCVLKEGQDTNEEVKLPLHPHHSFG